MSERRIEIHETDDGCYVSQFHSRDTVGGSFGPEHCGTILDVLIDIGYRLRRWEHSKRMLKQIDDPADAAHNPTPIEAMLLEALEGIATSVKNPIGSIRCHVLQLSEAAIAKADEMAAGKGD